MSHSTAGLRHKITSAEDLQSVVRTMKTMAASSIGQYERSVLALSDYYRTVEIGLGACLRESGTAAAFPAAFPPVLPPVLPGGDSTPQMTGAIVFGTDQGLVGQFNEAVAEFALSTLSDLPGEPQVWAVGERVHARLVDAGLTPLGCFPVPTSVAGIAPLVGRIQLESEAHREEAGYSSVYLIHNQPESAAYEPVSLRLLPLDAAWNARMTKREWPTQGLPEVLAGRSSTLRALIREYLFISMFRACAESLAAENSSRLTAMGRAERNIEEMLTQLNGDFRRSRQEGIDEELFEVISGYEALEPPP
jgi:F-type H+-transporting ATPase subunit gamma